MKKDPILKSVSEMLSVLIFLGGCIVMLGWIFDIPALKSISFRMVAMKTNAAACFILTGLALWLSQTKRSESRLYRFIAQCSAVIAALIGLFTMIEYMSGLNFGIDQFLFREPAGAVFTTYPNRMAFNSAFNFLIIGIVLLLLNGKKSLALFLSQLLVLIPGTVALLSLVSYLYGIQPIYFIGGYSTGLALGGTLLFIMISFSVLFIRPDEGMMANISADTAGGKMVRRLFPILIIIPLILGWLALRLEALGVFNKEFGEVFLTTLTIFITTIYTYWIAVFLNRAENVNKRSVELSGRLAAIVESSDDAIIGKSPDGTIISWNSGAERLYGYSREEIEGRNISIITTPDKLAELQNIYEKIKRGEKVEHFETIRCKKNGTCIDVSITVSPIKDAAGDIIGFSTIARDITERKNAEEALRKSEAWLSTTLRSIGDAVIATDAKGRVVFINPIAAKLTGWKQEEAAGRPMGEIFNIINEITNEPVENPVTKVIREGVIVGLANHTLLITKDGSRRPIDDSAAPIKDTKGNIIGVVLIFRDITERRNTEKAMQESVKAKSAFTSMVSHELRTPLGAIKEGVSLISDGILGEISEKQKHVLGLAKNNVDRLTRLINQVLDFQTLEAGKIQFKMEENDINKVIREVAETMDLIAKKKGLDLVLYLEDKLPRVIFDRDKINQVLANLIGNAIKFTDKGSVTVAASSGNNLIMVSVKDTGIGIRREDLPRLFRQYEQLERKAGGTGLGLAISAEMIRMHGGKIGAESEFGKGTTFYFILPVKERRDRSRDE